MDKDKNKLKTEKYKGYDIEFRKFINHNNENMIHSFINVNSRLYMYFSKTKEEALQYFKSLIDTWMKNKQKQIFKNKSSTDTILSYEIKEIDPNGWYEFYINFQIDKNAVRLNKYKIESDIISILVSNNYLKDVTNSGRPTNDYLYVSKKLSNFIKNINLKQETHTFGIKFE